MPWGFTIDKARAHVQRELQANIDAARAGCEDDSERAQLDIAAEMVRACVAMSGRPLVEGQRALANNALDARVAINASGAVTEDGAVRCYISVGVTPAVPLAELPPDTEAAQVGSASADAIRQHAERAAPPAERPEAIAAAQRQAEIKAATDAAAAPPAADTTGTAG